MALIDCILFLFSRVERRNLNVRFWLKLLNESFALCGST